MPGGRKRSEPRPMTCENCSKFLVSDSTPLVACRSDAFLRVRETQDIYVGQVGCRVLMLVHRSEYRQPSDCPRFMWGARHPRQVHFTLTAESARDWKDANRKKR